MKNLVLLVALTLTVTAMMGCTKKKVDETANMEGLNGVVSENVVSVTDQAAVPVGQEVPVVVDNAQSASAPVEDPMNAVVQGAKPTSKQIQQALKNAGVYNGKIDGDIGPRTKKAIEAFQTQNGLKADGKVGAKTWKALLAYLNKPTEVANPSEAVQTVGQ